VPLGGKVGNFMKNLFFIFFLPLIFTLKLFSQGLFTITTNKTNYSYGEVINVSVSLFNNTDSTLLFHPECVYPVWVGAKGVEFMRVGILADWCDRYFQPGERETWDFFLDPAKLAFPILNGEQIIYGMGYGHVDSIKITALKYYGGIIEVRFNYITEKEERDNFFNNITASVIKSDTLKDIQQIDEFWSVQNIDIDSLVYELNRSANHFGYVSTYRMLDPGVKTVTSIDDQPNRPNDFLLLQNYPNPFNPSTTISYKIPKAMRVKIIIFNSNGEKIKILEDKYKNSGFHKIIFNSEGLSSGVYYYQLITKDKIVTKKFVLLK
jgi:hypothetical protein